MITPGAMLKRKATLPLRRGRSDTCRLDITCETVAVAASSTVACAVTCMTSFTSPGARLTSSRMRSPVRSSTGDWLKPLNPASSASTL